MSYHSCLKPGLVFRGYRTYSPERILDFSARVGNGREFRIYARDNGLDVTTFAEFFSAQYKVLPPELPPISPKVIYDVGANIGIASLYFAVKYPGARFYGFEPLPLNHEVCVLNYRNLPRSEVFPWAVGAHTGNAPFQFSTQDSRGGRMTGRQPAGQQVHEKIEVPLFSVAALAKKTEPPDFLKIDVEGAELEVLEGLGDQSRRVKRMLIETHGEEVQLQCLQWIVANGFTVRHLHEAAPGFAAIWCDRV